MSLNDLVGNFTSSVTSKAKDTAISTLKDPEIKAAVNQFTKDWLYEHRFILATIVGGYLVLSILAISNIISNARAR